MFELLTQWRIIIEDFLKSNIQPLSKDILVADIGYGDSTFILRNAFPQLEIIDSGQKPKDLKIHQLNICDDIPVNLCSHYNLVCCCETLEHTKQPFIAAQNILKLTKPNGIILISVPCHIFYHAMLPFCDDYWRFFESSIPLLFPNNCQILQVNSHYNNLTKQTYDMPIGITATLQKIEGET